MIVNLTKKKVLAKDVKFCKSVFSKFIGLRFSRRMRESLVFVFEKERKVSLDMFFVFYPIDVLWLDEDKKVVGIKENFKPFSFTFGKKARYVLELENGVARKTRTEIGDKIGF